MIINSNNPLIHIDIFLARLSFHYDDGVMNLSINLLRNIINENLISTTEDVELISYQINLLFKNCEKRKINLKEDSTIIEKPEDLQSINNLKFLETRDPKSTDMFPDSIWLLMYDSTENKTLECVNSIIENDDLSKLELVFRIKLCLLKVLMSSGAKFDKNEMFKIYKELGKCHDSYINSKLKDVSIIRLTEILKINESVERPDHKVIYKAM